MLHKQSKISFLFRLFRDLTTYADRLTIDEAKEAIQEAPLVKSAEKPKNLLETEYDHLIDYPSWILKFAGFRKYKREIYLD